MTGGTLAHTCRGREGQVVTSYSFIGGAARRGKPGAWRPERGCGQAGEAAGGQRE